MAAEKVLEEERKTIEADNAANEEKARQTREKETAAPKYPTKIELPTLWEWNSGIGYPSVGHTGVHDPPPLLRPQSRGQIREVAVIRAI